MSPLVSIIICTFNRPTFLQKCLESFYSQESPIQEFEIVVVNNNSKDDTEAVALDWGKKEWMKKKSSLKYVFEEKQGLSHARNRGVEVATGEYLLYFDDDAFAPPNYLRSLFEVILYYQPDIFGGPVYPYYTDSKPWWFRDEYEIRKHTDKSGFSKLCKVSGGNFGIKKSILIQLGLFDPSLGMQGGKIGMCEETKVLETYRMKTSLFHQRVYYSLELFIYHYTPKEKMSVGYILKRNMEAGRSSIFMHVSMGRYGRSALLLRAKTKFKKACLKLFQEIVQQGPLKADYVDAMRDVAYALGMLKECVKL